MIGRVSAVDFKPFWWLGLAFVLVAVAYIWVSVT